MSNPSTSFPSPNSSHLSLLDSARTVEDQAAQTGDPSSEPADLFYLSQAILDEVNCSILATLAGQALTANELVRRLQLPMTTCYRRLSSLSQRGLIKERLEPEGKKGHTTKVYTSLLESLTLHYEGNTVRLDLAFHNLPGQVFTSRERFKYSLPPQP